MAKNKTSFSLEDDYLSKFNYLVSVTNSKDNKSLIKKFIDEFIDLSEEDNSKLDEFCDKTNYTRKKFFKEAIEYYLDKKVKQYSKVNKKEKETDKDLKKKIDEMIVFFDSLSIEDKKYLNINTINKYLKEKGINKNIEVIKRVYINYDPIHEYHIRNNLKPNHNVELGLKNRIYKNKK
jgi:predicted DNA-binding protein